jgi:16S rRNA (cytosine1402-N4)-methyltransferase
MHQSVLLNETLDALDLAPGAFIVDGTVDGGGHSAAILEKIGKDGRLLGIDWDPALLEECRARIGHDPRITLRHGNYADTPTFLKEEGLPKANAFLLDLGFSSEQLQGSGKGLSFQKDEPLAMTYDPGATPAYEILHQLSEEEIVEMIRELGEERYAARIGKAIYSRERKQPIMTTGELETVIKEAVPGSYEHGRLNPATRTFQALRIYANDELGNLRKALKNLPEVVESGGRVAMISFHSLEDRIVKHVFREMEKEGILKILTKKPIEATDEEILKNPRARSAKLRVAIMN